jgi:hypothetical protein
MGWPNLTQKINKMQSICYFPDWTSTQELVHATMIYWNQRLIARIGMGKKVSTYLDPWILISIFLPAWPPCSSKDRRRGEGGGAGENEGWVTVGCFIEET